MRVLEIGNLYPPHGFGGYELLWRDAVAAQEAAGQSVCVLCTDYRHEGAEGERDSPNVHRELRWYWRDYEFPHLTRRERLAIERWNARVLARHLREQRPQCAVVWNMGGMSLSLLEHLRRAQVPTLAVVADEWLGYAPDADGWMRAWRRLPRIAHLLARPTGLPTRFDLGGVSWLFISHYLAERATRLCSLDLGAVEVVSPGVNPERFPPGRADTDWQWRLLYAGRFEEAKGVDVAVEALAGMPPTATLTLDGAGDPAYVGSLRSRADALGLGERVRILRSPSDQMGSAYRQADAVLFPVRWNEPWGMVPLEAMSVGTPVVATSQGGTAEYLRHEENSLIVPREDPAALTAAVHRLAGDAELRERLRVGGASTVERFPASAFFDAVVARVTRVASK